MLKLNRCGGVSIYVWRQALATAASCFLSLCGGLVFGITAVMLPQLANDDSFPYDLDDESWIASITTLSMILGCLCTGTIIDYFGRKFSHIILNLPSIVGWLSIAFASNNTSILIGRFLTGLSAGAHRSITLVYIGELSKPKYRSIFLLIPALMTHAGVILSHVVGKYFYWKTSCLLCMTPSVLCGIFFIFLKESPLWLISKGRIEEGVAAFKWFRGDDDAANNELQNVLEKQKGKIDTKNCGELKNMLCNRTFLKPFIICFVLTLCIQASGVNAMSFYAENIFDSTFDGKLDGYTLMIATDIVRAAASISICIFAKYLPKRKSFLCFCFCVVASLAALVIFLYLNPDGLMWIPVVLIVMYIIFAGIVVTLGWTFAPEILPNNVRGTGLSIASAVGYIVLFIAVKTLPYVVIMYGEAAMYGGFAVATFIFGTILCFILPETKDRTLQSIEDGYTDEKCDTKL